jgi:hypothetical protein
MTRKGNFGEWVKIRWDGTPSGTLVCPHHGNLPAATAYTPGIAPCGCEFVLLPGGVLRAIRQPASLTNTPDTGTREAVQTGASCATG